MEDNQSLTIMPGAFALMPVMNIQQAKHRYEQFREFVRECMTEGTDYGPIPGSDKPTLKKPGAEKLNTLFGLSARLTCVDKVEDWTGQDHDGEPFFYYRYNCAIYAGLNLVVESEASCNSWEVKYRYRQGERKCPRCKMATIIKGKAEYGGGWLCFKKKGGCGSTFLDGDEVIESQQVGRISNPDVCDQVNTFQKMGQKRAYVGSSILATNASEYFTQDLEDGPVVEHEASANGQQRKGDSGKLKTPPASVAVSPEESRINLALIQHFQKEKGDRTGFAFFEGVWLPKPLAAREAEAKRLGLTTPSEPEKPATGQQDAKNDPFAGEPDPRRQLLGEIIGELKANKITEKAINAEMARLCDGNFNRAKLDDADVEGLIVEFSLWIDRINAESEK